MLFWHSTSRSSAVPSANSSWPMEMVSESRSGPLSTFTYRNHLRLLPDWWPGVCCGGRGGVTPRGTPHPCEVWACVLVLGPEQEHWGIAYPLISKSDLTLGVLCADDNVTKQCCIFGQLDQYHNACHCDFPRHKRKEEIVSSSSLLRLFSVVFHVINDGTHR